MAANRARRYIVLVGVAELALWFFVVATLAVERAFVATASLSATLALWSLGHAASGVYLTTLVCCPQALVALVVVVYGVALAFLDAVALALHVRTIVDAGLSLNPFTYLYTLYSALFLVLAAALVLFGGTAALSRETDVAAREPSPPPRPPSLPPTGANVRPPLRQRHGVSPP